MRFAAGLEEGLLISVPFSVAARRTDFFQRFDMRKIDDIEAVLVHDDLPMIRLRRHQHEFRMHDADFPATVEAKCERVKRSCFQTFPESFGTHASECIRAAAGLKPATAA